MISCRINHQPIYIGPLIFMTQEGPTFISIHSSSSMILYPKIEFPFLKKHFTSLTFIDSAAAIYPTGVVSFVNPFRPC